MVPCRSTPGNVALPRTPGTQGRWLGLRLRHGGGHERQSTGTSLIKHVHRYWGIFCQQTNFKAKGRPLPSEQFKGNGGLFTHIPKHKRSVTIQGSTCTLARGRNKHNRLYTITPTRSVSRSLPAVNLDIYLWLDIQTLNSLYRINLDRKPSHTISHATTTIIDISLSSSA